MVLASIGLFKTEEELRASADTTFIGTEALGIVDAAKYLGFFDSSKQNLQWQELLAVLSEGHFPIVYLRLRFNLNGPLQTHAVVVLEVSKTGVAVLDPVRGEITLSVDEFQLMWGLTRRLTILIEPLKPEP